VEKLEMVILMETGSKKSEIGSDMLVAVAGQKIPENTFAGPYTGTSIMISNRIKKKRKEEEKKKKKKRKKKKRKEKKRKEKKRKEKKRKEKKRRNKVENKNK
jgi:hypothetical protein